MLRSFHRLLGAFLVLPLLLWTVTGLAFLVKPGWRGAYEQLSAFIEEPLDAGGLQPLPSIVAAQSEHARPTRIELGTTTLGPVYRVTTSGASSYLVDARTGGTLSPLDLDAATRVAIDAAARAHAGARYGDTQGVEVEEDVIAVAFAGGAIVRVGRTDLSISQSGRDTALIDWLYRAHYLQWTGIALVDRILALVAIVGVWALAAAGLSLMPRSRVR